MAFIHVLTTWKSEYLARLSILSFYYRQIHIHEYTHFQLFILPFVKKNAQRMNRKGKFCLNNTAANSNNVFKMLIDFC